MTRRSDRDCRARAAQPNPRMQPSAGGAPGSARAAPCVSALRNVGLCGREHDRLQLVRKSLDSTKDVHADNDMVAAVLLIQSLVGLDWDDDPIVDHQVRAAPRGLSARRHSGHRG